MRRERDKKTYQQRLVFLEYLFFAWGKAPTHQIINQIAMAQEPAVWLVLLAALMVAAAANSEDGVGIGEDSDLHLSRSRELYDGDLGENPGQLTHLHRFFGGVVCRNVS